MMDTEFFGLTCFEGGRLLSNQIEHISARLGDLLASDLVGEGQLRTELTDMGSALASCVGHAKRLETKAEPATTEAKSSRPKPYYWLRYYRR